jgi:uncharacterized membrane protein YccC
MRKSAFGTTQIALRRLKTSILRNRRDALRVALQTAAASVATYAVMSWLGQPHVSWAVISALFTIHVSADASLRTALGRLGGTLLGVAVGLAVVMAVDGVGRVAIGLAVSAAIANAVATVWPSLQYAAVIAAMIALNHDPEVGNALQMAFAIFAGSAIGTCAAFLAWPDFSRDRTARMVRETLGHCRDLLRLAIDSVEADNQEERDAIHARVLGDLQEARERASGTWFRPRFARGVSFRDAIRAAEGLWHALVVLDRAVAGHRSEIGERAIQEVTPAARDVQQAACAFIDDAIRALDDEQAEIPPVACLRHSVASAREAAVHASGDDQPLRNAGNAAGLLALIFALGEVERRLLEIRDLIEAGRSGGRKGQA